MKLYNTLTRRVEPFTPLDPQGKKVAMYVCGPTVYDASHLGHLRSAFVFDILRRELEAHPYEVSFVRNVTDVDDKIIERARKEAGANDLNAACQAVSNTYLNAYHKALAQLGIQPPTIEPKATEHVVPEMTDFIGKLLVQGVAYEAKGDVYFSVRKHTGYGALSNRTVEDLQAGARVEPGEHKQDPMDFALWKASKPGEPTWNSPWGPGRPGWHIECSAMSVKYLGSTFDIHGGGLDLIFPHHENELAQSQAAGHAFARWWVHHGLLTVNGEKMSKSLGNYITVDQALEQCGGNPDVLKLFFLKTHYRSPIDYSGAKVEEAKKNLEEFHRFFEHFRQVFGESDMTMVEASDEEKNFYDALEDDLNTPKALVSLFNLVNMGQKALDSQSSDGKHDAYVMHRQLSDCGKRLGLFLSVKAEDLDGAIQARIDDRNAARRARDFQRADEIRQALEREGILLTDTPAGTLWQRKR